MLTYNDAARYIEISKNIGSVRRALCLNVLSGEEGPITVMDAFLWRATPHGHDFWLNFAMGWYKDDPEKTEEALKALRILASGGAPCEDFIRSVEDYIGVG